MTQLEILQQRFSDMAQQFPGLMHILNTWPEDEKEPKLKPKYMPTKDNLLVIWGHALVGWYMPQKNMKHWLIKPHSQLWNKDHASENFQDLAEKAGRVLYEEGYLSRLTLPESILKLSEYKLNNSQKEQLWVLVVHELGNTKRFVSKPSDIKACILHDIIPDKFEEKPPSAYYEVQKDFFYESSLVISRLLEIEDLNKQGLSQTRHSPDFRSVNWFGTVHYFTATQAAIVKLLWDARKNQTPDIGQQTLLVTVESDSNRLVDVFKGHKTYKKLIGNGETKGSYRLTEPNK